MTSKEVIRREIDRYLDESGYGPWVDDEKRGEMTERIAKALEENEK